MVKSLFSGWFPLYLEPVAELLGFRSPKAKWCVKNCTDHHKAWQILEVKGNEYFYEVITSSSFGFGLLDYIRIAIR